MTVALSTVLSHRQGNHPGHTASAKPAMTVQAPTNARDAPHCAQAARSSRPIAVPRPYPRKERHFAAWTDRPGGGWPETCQKCVPTDESACLSIFQRVSSSCISQRSIGTAESIPLIAPLSIHETTACQSASGIVLAALDDCAGSSRSEGANRCASMNHLLRQ